MPTRSKLILGNLTGGIAYLVVANLPILASGRDRSPIDATLVTGVAVAAVLLFGPWVLPGVLIGAAGVTVELGWGPACCAAVLFNVVATAAIAAQLLECRGFDHSLRRLQDTNRFVVWGALLPSLIVSLPTAALFALAGDATGDFFSTWISVLALSATGILVIGAFTLVLSTLRLEAVWSWKRVRMVAAIVVLVTASTVLFSGTVMLTTAQLLIMLVLAAAYGPIGAVCGAAALAIVDPLPTVAAGWASFGAAGKLGPIAPGTIFVSAATVASLLVAAAFSERQLVESAHEELEQTTRELEDAQALGQIGSFVLDRRSGDATLSEQAALITGAPRSIKGNIASMWLSAVDSADRDQAETRVRELLASGETGSVTFRSNQPPGHVRWIEARLRCECERIDGPPIRIHGTIQDITARKLTEIRMAALFENAPYPILVIDGQGQLLKSNLPANALFGLGSAQEQRSASIDDLLSPTGIPDLHWFVTAAEGDTGGAGAGVELSGRDLGGHRFVAEAFVIRVPSESGVHYSIGLRDVTNSREVVETLRFQARHDPLTELPNRLMFAEQLEQALVRAGESGRPLAVIFADLDNFKHVNDTAGHDVGDMALAAFGGRLLGAIRDGDLLARFAGDEFVLLCEDIADEHEAREMVQRLVDTISGSPFELAGHRFALSLSAGVLLVEHPETTDVESILRAADSEMYRAKIAGKRRRASIATA